MSNNLTGDVDPYPLMYVLQLVRCFTIPTRIKSAAAAFPTPLGPVDLCADRMSTILMYFVIMYRY